MNKRQKRAAKFFGLIYFGFTVILLVLGLNQQGLKIIEKKDSVWLENSSGHKINNVTVLLSEDQKLDCIKELPAKTKQKIVLPEGLGRAKLSVIAPFHGRTDKIIDMKTDNTEKMDIRFDVPEKQKKFQRFNAKVKICNYENSSKQVTVSEEHDKKYFFSDKKSIVFILKGKECKTINFDFSPQLEGITKIKLFVKGLDFQKTSVHEIIVEG